MPWSVIDLLLNTWFLIELLARFLTCPCKCTFTKKKLNWVDMFAVVCKGRVKILKWKLNVDVKGLGAWVHQSTLRNPFCVAVII